ncbi:MAG: type 4b pilus protein PilO2 [Alphaproteobacteria bacterium]|nr:type 4b pilus protein PilO2 [Alphaproteobacteria bacterium]
MENTNQCVNAVESQNKIEPGGTLNIDGTVYAVGLLWQSLQNPDDPLPEIREVIESEPGYDLYCLRPASAPQYGIGKKSMGHAEGQPSAAAAVASAYADKTSVCAVFRIKEGWWFVSIRNDLILSEEDRLFVREEDAQRAFFSMMAVPDWDIKIAPSEWQIDGAEQVVLADLIKNARKVRLQELSAMRKTQFLIGIALFIIVVVIGIFYLISSLWDSVFTPKKIVAVPTPEVIKPVEPTPEKPKPWEKVPDTLHFLNKCWDNSYQLSNLTIPQWKMGTVVCTPTGIETSWSKQNGGRIAFFKAAIDEYRLSRVSVSLNDSGTSAKGTVQFTDLPTIATIPTLSADQIRDEFIDITQATGLPIQYSKQTVQDPPNNPDGSVPPNQQTYEFYAFTVSSGYSPWEWKEFFDKFSGLELLKVEYNPAIEATNNKWKYEGRIYAK